MVSKGGSALKTGIKSRAAAAWVSIAFLSAPSALSALNATVNVGVKLAAIPDQTYGSNQPLDAPVKLYRHGGNRWTGYNWEINASNAGADWHNSNDFWLNSLAGLPQRGGLDPAALVLRHLLRDKEAGAESIITVPMAGYVAADGNGSVGDEPAPNKRWDKVIPRKGKPFSDSPDLEDGRVYVDEFVHYLHQHWGKAANGVKYFDLDNEPAIWNATHPRIHPKPAGYQELMGRSLATASAILDLDADAQILGPALYGWQAAIRLQDAPDSAEHNAKYGWFVSYYLDQMRLAGEAQHRRLLDYFDLHWYPEARGGGLRITEAGADHSAALVEARLQAPRSLWDPEYVEDSWITKSQGGKPIALIPRLQASVDQYYPGTKLAFSEFSYGGGDQISGGLAVADALGIFGEHGALACHWSTSRGEAYTSAAYRLYLDYDGKGSRYGDQAVSASEDDKQALSVHAATYASVPGRLSVLVIHKDQKDRAPLSLSLDGYAGTTVQAWRLQDGSSSIVAASGAAVKDGLLTDSLPPLSATLYVLETR